MPEQPHESASQLPDSPNLEWLRKQAKSRFAELRRENPEAKLADAQFAIAKQYGFSSWRALKAHLDALTLEGQIIETARKGDVERLARLLDEHPDKLHLNVPPYEASLLFPAAQSGNVDAVQLLLERGLDVNYREKGDNTYVMHWAAAQGHLEMVRTLADAGGDVIGEGDDHAFGVIGWASCWEGCNDDKHRAVVDFLISRGARHHIFSAVAMNLADEVRRIVAADPSALNQRQSRNENNRTPLHFAVAMSLPQMVNLLLEHGANPDVLWAHWEADVTPLHLAAAHGHGEVVRLLLDAGADPRIRDTRHDGDALGWAEFFKQPDIVQLLKDQTR